MGIFWPTPISALLCRADRRQTETEGAFIAPNCAPRQQRVPNPRGAQGRCAQAGWGCSSRIPAPPPPPPAPGLRFAKGKSDVRIKRPLKISRTNVLITSL